MKKHFRVYLLLGSSLFAAEPGALQTPDTLYTQRCRQVLQQMDSTDLMLVASAGVKNRCGDVDYPYRQDSNMLYLCGWRHPSALLMLSPRGVNVGGKAMHTICFYNSKALESTAYHRPPRLAAVCDTMLALDRFDASLSQALSGIRTLYYSLPKPVFVQEPVTGKHFFLDRELRKALRNQYPGLTIKPVAEPLNRLRQIKSDAEIRLLQKAVDITAAGLREAIKSAEPGMYEYELQAVIE
ncbi:MAG TPA: Xaa-Pro aminopeptidase, partial [bacterium]|nr:Xaa-Pro aminopeptidase [bacterium]